MSDTGFQFHVTSRAQPGFQVFVVMAASQSQAEKLIQRDRSIGSDSTIELQRQISADDIAKYKLGPGAIRKIR